MRRRRKIYQKIEKIILPKVILKQAFQFFQKFGKSCQESSVIWIGRRRENEFQITDIWIPEQLNTTVSFLIPSYETHRISRDLFNYKLELIAQLHTHPKNAFHSHVDDKGSMLLIDGQFSIVIPYFGYIQHDDMEKWKVYRKSGDQWRYIESQEVVQLFQII